MSEQMVIVVLIALTFAIVLVALAIPDDLSPDAESLDAIPTATVSDTNAVIDRPVAAVEDHPVRDDETGTQGVETDDARGAGVIPEEAGR